MSRQQMEHLLQECLEGFDAGLSPEECLSAYPHARAELEPMFRQALSLRFAYAAAPSEEFRRRGRESLLFHAGRDVSQALSKEPDSEFVMDARQRFLIAAGSQAQEALRDVPPPRLPFWMNARRHLLDAAANPAPRPSRQHAFVMRSAMSGAVIMLAVAVATLGFFLTSNPADGPGATRNASANINYIEDTLDQIEKQNAQGIQTSASVLVELTNRTSTLSAQIAAGEVEGPLAARVPALIERQQDIVNAAVVTSTEEQPELIEAAQRLSQAEVRVAAAVVETPAATATSVITAAGPTVTPTPQATASPTATPESTPVTSDPVDQKELGPDQVLVAVDITDKTFSTASNPLPWVRVTTSKMTFLIASAWEISNIETDQDGLAVISADFTIQTGSDEVPAIIVNDKNGEVNALIDGISVQLRTEDGEVMDAAKLLELVPSRMAPVLHHFINSFEFGAQDDEDLTGP